MSSRVRITERRLVDVLVRHIRRTHRVARELPVYDRYVDIAAVCEETGELWTIEAKISDWARALAQAVVNLAAGEKSYIAIHSRSVHCVPIAALQEYGIGLISVGTRWDDVTVIHHADRSKYLNLLVCQRLKKRIPA